MTPEFSTRIPLNSRTAVFIRITAFFLLLIIVGIPSYAQPKPSSPSAHKVEHSLTIVHPGDAEAKPTPHTLTQWFDQHGEPTAYSMWVDSVICRDKTCEVVKVQLHWDALGHYQRFGVAYGSQLTKLDHVPFTPKDLTKLQGILKDLDSPLKEVEKEAMTAKAAPKLSTSDADDAGVAAVSQPTILNLKTAVILGAGYTCYDLWHWSNGLLTEYIRDFTGKDCSDKKLRSYLESADTDSTQFALKYAKKRQLTEPSFFNAVIKRSKSGSEKLITPALAYLKQAAASNQIYDDSIISLFSEADSKKRLLILEALSAESQKHLPGFYDALCDYLPTLESYYEVHLFLNLMNKKNPGSAKVAEKAAELLKHEKFFVSRRVYAYLEKQSLSADLQKQVTAYLEKNKDRL
ncbi:MAG: hypothetical protein GXP30_08855 [Verrucomicrobia bacterium]|nr:hypothetical protein [Verrucomicrobiota bacterium]